MAERHEFNLAMTCEGCSNAARRVLGKVPEVTDVEIDMEKKSVYLKTTLSPEAVVEILKKTGKDCTYIGKA